MKSDPGKAKDANKCMMDYFFITSETGCADRKEVLLIENGWSRLAKHGFFSYLNRCINVIGTMIDDKGKILEKQLRDECSLFRLAASGDKLAFRKIFELFGPRLFSYLVRVIKSPEEAKELVQEIFLKLWIKRQYLAEIESPQHYIFMMARNRAVDYLRKSALDLRMRHELWRSINENRNSTEEQVFANDNERLIDAAIYKLSLQQQIVFRLSRVEGRTHGQIAVQLNISKNTVKNHIVASLKFIRNYLSHHRNVSVIPLSYLFF